MSSIKLNSSETFSFTWLDDKNKTIATSTNFVKQKDCLEAIELLKDKCFDAAIENRIDPDSKKSSFPKFIITGTSRSCTFAFALSEKNTVLSSVKFNSLTLCLETIESIKKNVISVYEQFKIDLRVDNYLNELNEKNVRQDSTKINIVKQGLRKMPVFMAKKSTPLFATKKNENDNLKKLNGDRPLILRISRGKRPTFVDGKFTAEKVTSLKKAVSSLNSLHHTMGFKNAEQEFKECSLHMHTKADFYRLQQYHEGIPVYGHQLIISTDKSGNVNSLSGCYAKISTSGKVAVSEDEAIVFVKKLAPETTSLTSEGLHYYVDDNDKSTLCWKISTDSLMYFIDVAKAAVVHSLATCICKNYESQDVGKNMWNEEECFPVTVDKKGTRYLYDPKRDIEVLRCRKAGTCNGDKITSASSEWKNEREAISAYTNVIKVYDYYKNVLGRFGADGKEKPIKVVVDYFEKVGEPYGGGACYVDRNGNTNICIAENQGYERCLDVMAHEYTHGVEDFIWNPVYENESGALNEAYADIMGEFVQDGVLDTHAENQYRDDLWRYFDDPTKSKYRYSKDYANRFIGPCDKENDYGGVHWNCGIICHAAYRIQENWPLENIKFSGIMPAVFYLSMNYLSPKSNFLDFREALLHAARVYNLGNEVENVIADALDYVGVVYPKENNPKGAVLTGKVVDSSDKQPIRDARVSLYDCFLISLLKETVTDASGMFELGFDAAGMFGLIVKSPAYDIYSQIIQLPDSGYDRGLIRLNRSPEEKATLQVSIKNSITKDVKDVDVYICEGNVSVDEALNKIGKIEIHTNENGLCSTNLVKLNSKYTVIAQKIVSDEYLFGSQVVSIDKETAYCEVNLDKRKRSFINYLRVSWSDGTSIGQNRVRNRIISEGCTLVDKDLNYGARGYFIYLGYKVSINDTRPVTNVVIYSSPKKQTWHDMNITVLGKKG